MYNKEKKNKIIAMHTWCSEFAGLSNMHYKIFYFQYTPEKCKKMHFSTFVLCMHGKCSRIQLAENIFIRN